ncbi:MAG: FAD-binding oxidoreductase [Chloroflexi bacterium]|nr:FAD-binding oxidoreductase [Chloroflexota bacterium]MBP8058583.1 FAD-binding oxidoreductase [Chloroflexota bacterium]
MQADVVICGAGIAGISAAYHLAVRHGVKNIVIVDERPPLTLTSDKSTECYRNWWPDGPMVQFMNRSIDILEELAEASDNFFHLNRRGYAFFTANPETAREYEQQGRETEQHGGGKLRIHRGRNDDPPFSPPPTEGYLGQPDGADLFLDRDLILQHYPYLNPDVVAAIIPRRCGSLSAQQLGMYLLGKVKERGVKLVRGRVTGINVVNNQVQAVCLSGADVDIIHTPIFVNAAGPYVREVGQLLGVDIPVFNELHGKIAVEDYLNLLPRNLPLMIWSDPVRLPWSEAERHELEQEAEMRWLLNELPAGVHFRSEGAGGASTLLVLWTYELDPKPPIWPPTFDPMLPEVVLRGLTRMVPALSVYLEKGRKPYVDGGYYCKTRENRLLVGPLPVEGAYLIGALSGYGIMASPAAADLLACHITGGALPEYAAAFHPNRYQDPTYLAQLAQWDATSGQL